MQVQSPDGSLMMIPTVEVKEYTLKRRSPMPKDYKAKLENRSYAPGASREGKTLEEMRRNRALRKDYIGD